MSGGREKGRVGRWEGHGAGGLTHVHSDVSRGLLSLPFIASIIGFAFYFDAKFFVVVVVFFLPSYEFHF